MKPSSGIASTPESDNFPSQNRIPFRSVPSYLVCVQYLYYGNSLTPASFATPLTFGAELM